ncbi:MAG: ROK family protein, partial [Frankiaceae bacterium]|nr:ROK family protein [Frankiaceae bacterium]
GLLRRRHEVPCQPSRRGEGEALWGTLVKLVEAVCADALPGGIGVGCGGPMRWPQGVVSPLNIAAWRDFPLRVRLREMFPGAHVRVANDAIALAVGEHWRGAGVGVRNLMGVVVSTGVGGGLVLDGRVEFGETGNAGHLGHVVVDPDGPECVCGGRVCLESIARGPAVVQWAPDHGGSMAGEPDGRTLVAAARAGEQIAIEAFARAGTALGTAVASAAHLLELDVVAIGGGLANAGDLLLGPARSAFACHARMEFASRCHIVRAGLDVDAGLIGAAALVVCGDQYWPSGAD